MAVGVVRLFLLEMSRVGEHDSKQLERSSGAVDRPREANPRQAREIARVVNVGVAQKDGREGCGVKGWRRPVLEAKLLQSLKEAALEEQARWARVEEELGAGDGARGAEERERRGHWLESIFSEAGEEAGDSDGARRGDRRGPP